MVETTKIFLMQPNLFLSENCVKLHHVDSLVLIYSIKNIQMYYYYVYFFAIDKYVITQVRIAEGDNTAQYWANLGSQESAIVIGSVSLFAPVKCWADDGGLFRLFKFTDLQPKLRPVKVYTGVIIPAAARYWQPIFGKFLAMLGQCWAVSNFALGKFNKISNSVHNQQVRDKTVFFNSQF